MSEAEIENLLSWHADETLSYRERAGVDTSAALAGRPREWQSSVGGLMRLAERVSRVVVSVQPRPAFVASLQQQLAAAPPAPSAGTPLPVSREQRLMWIGLGGAAVLASVGVVGYLAARAGRGQARPAGGGPAELQKARPLA